MPSVPEPEGTPEPQEGTYWERDVLRRWLTGGHVDIRIVKRQVAALLAFVEEQEGMDWEHPLEPAEPLAEALKAPEPIQWTGDNDQAVREWLGGRFEKVRGGLDANDPKVLWFRTGSVGGYLAWARPGDWLIWPKSGFISTMSDEDYRRPR